MLRGQISFWFFMGYTSTSIRLAKKEPALAGYISSISGYESASFTTKNISKFLIEGERRIFIRRIAPDTSFRFPEWASGSLRIVAVVHVEIQRITQLGSGKTS